MALLPPASAPVSLPAVISWTTWTVRPAGWVHASADERGSYSTANVLSAQMPALIVGYSSGALQIYVFNTAASSTLDDQTSNLDEVMFLPRVPLPTPMHTHAQDTPSKQAAWSQRRLSRRASSVGHASRVFGAVYVSPTTLLVLVEGSASAQLPSQSASGAADTRAVYVVVLSLAVSGGADATTKTSIPKAIASYKLRDLAPNHALVTAELRASGTSFIAAALTTCKLDDPFAPLASELHALRVSAPRPRAASPNASASGSAPHIQHACAPLSDLPAGVRPTFDLCGRVLAYAAGAPNISLRDRAMGGNFNAAAGAFGSQMNAGAGGDGSLSGDGVYGLGGMGGGGAGGSGASAAAAVMSLGHRAAAAGLSSVSALTAAAAARFSPSSIGSGTGVPSPSSIDGAQGLPTSSGPGWEQHASAAASAISIGAGAGVDVAKRVGSGVLSGVRGLSGYFGNAQQGPSMMTAHRTHSALSSSSSPPYVPSQFSRSAPSSQGVLMSGNTPGGGGAAARMIPGFTSANAVDRVPSPYGTSPAQQRRFSGGVHHRNSISQRFASKMVGAAGETVPVTSSSPVTGAMVAEDSAVQSSSDSPLLQPSSHEEILPGGVSVPQNDAVSVTSTSVGSKRYSTHSLSGAQTYDHSGAAAHGMAAVASPQAQPSSFSQMAMAQQARQHPGPGPVWVRVVDLGSVPPTADGDTAATSTSLPRPRTLALFRPPNSSLGLLSQVGLGWSAGSNAAAQSGPGGGSAALLSSSLPRSPPAQMGNHSVEYASSFSSSVAGGGVGGLPPFSPTGALPFAGSGSGNALPLGSNPVALLSLSPDGSSLLTADALGQVFHVWEMMPCPAPVVLPKTALGTGSSGGVVSGGDARNRGGRVTSHGSAAAGNLEEESLPPSVWHRYKLMRGLTSAQAVAATWSGDAQFVFVQSQKGTVHAYPVNPYGGVPDANKHLQRPGASGNQGFKALGLSNLSIEVKAIARLRPVDIPAFHSIPVATGAEAGATSPTQTAITTSGRSPVASMAAPSLMLLKGGTYPEPPSMIPSEVEARRLQFLVYHPARDSILLHSFACAALPSATASNSDAASTSTHAGGNPHSDRAGAGGLISGLPRSVSAPVAAAATGAAAVASSGLSRMMSRTGSSWAGAPAGGGRGADGSASTGGGAAVGLGSGRIFTAGSGGNSGHCYGLLGDSIAFAAWCGLARVVMQEGPALEGDESAVDVDHLELGDDDEEEIGLGDDAETMEKRALFRTQHLRHGSSPLARPAVQVPPSESSSPSGSDEENGARAKSTGVTPISTVRAQAQMQARLQVAEHATASSSSSAEMGSSASPSIGEGKKTTATSSPAPQGGKKKRKGSTKAAGATIDAAIPVLELPPPKTSGAPPDQAAVTAAAKAEPEAVTVTPPAVTKPKPLPPFTPPSWVTQIEVETFSRAPRVLPSSIWLSHQFEFREAKTTSTAAAAPLHTLYKHKTAKLEVREEVQVDAPTGDGKSSFDEGLLSAIGARAFDGASARRGGAGVLGEDGTVNWKVPMFPQGQRARHPAWHERVIAAGGLPIRQVAGGLGHGLGRAGRGLGRSVEEAIQARRKRSSGIDGTSGYEAFDFDDEEEEEEEGNTGDASRAEGQEASAFLEVRAAKEAAGLSVEDLRAIEVDSDDEQTWKDARKANQGLDDEFAGWDEFAAEGCAPAQRISESVSSRRGKGYVVGLLEEDGGVGAPASRAAAAAAAAPGQVLSRGAALVSSGSGGPSKSSSASGTTPHNGLPLPASSTASKNASSSGATGKAGRGAMPGSLPLPATAAARSSSSSSQMGNTSSSRRKGEAGSNAQSGNNAFDLYSRQA
ncbi:hypothetical protein OC842_005910 [Tilletia horrida]|uniref:BCAS3 WD40 domain-containing protein n=1 Tax=Tilletia horrida TaxID=155126 RepID=A0AAN6G8Z1_9BASI|nr:hypothetical protein OC842_005910 [Tilletia horrida]